VTFLISTSFLSDVKANLILIIGPFGVYPISKVLSGIIVKRGLVNKSFIQLIIEGSQASAPKIANNL
jgi:hypothetical protein